MENQEKTKELKEVVRNLVAVAKILVELNTKIKIATLQVQEYIDANVIYEPTNEDCVRVMEEQIKNTFNK
jgi:hypothetical protein